MKIYRLLSISEADFINIDLDYGIDSLYFIDPFAILYSSDRYSTRIVNKLKTYFESIVDNIDDRSGLSYLYSHASEFPYSKIGYSTVRPGTGIGDRLLQEVVSYLESSEAIRDGYALGIEDFTIFVPKIKDDRISDWISNIISDVLLEYTHDQLSKYPISFNYTSFELAHWDENNLIWVKETKSIPTYEGTPFLLTPIDFVSPKHVLLEGLANFVDLGLLTLLKDEFDRYGLSELCKPYKDPKRSNELRSPSKKSIREYIQSRTHKIYFHYSTLVYFEAVQPGTIRRALKLYKERKLEVIEKRTKAKSTKSD